MSEIYYSQTAQWESFLAELRQSFRVFIPQAKDKDYLYEEFKDTRNFSFNAYRPVQPIKSFLTYSKEKVAEGFSLQTKLEEIIPTVVVGLKNCDLHSLKIQDFVFEEGIEIDTSTALSVNGERPSTSLGTSPEFIEGRSRTIDPLYNIRRENTILISGDCTGFKEVCFCLALEVLPHPTEGFDLNLSPLTDGYLVEVGSGRGKDLIEKYQGYFKKANPSQMSAREAKRKHLIDELNSHLFPQHLPKKDTLQKIVRQGYNSDTWHNFCLTCVECGACNFICCTCHCFLLSDVKDKDKYLRLRIWDSCQYANFARVAGGANPLKRRSQRLRNRFIKKFDFFVDNLGMPACEGCGRCIETCPGKIDIREILKDLARHA